MPGTSPTYLPALALTRRPAHRLAAEDVSLRPFCRSVLFLVALSLPVLASAVADRFHSDGSVRTVGALAVPPSPLGGTARQPDHFAKNFPASLPASFDARAGWTLSR